MKNYIPIVFGFIAVLLLILRYKHVKPEKNTYVEPKVIDINYISNNIYLGSHEALLYPKILKQKNITHILTINELFTPHYIQQQFIHKQIPIKDHPEENITKIIPEALKFIYSSDTILIQCVAGRSRSPSIVISYLMHKYNISFDEAYSFVSKKRNININDGFVQQLQKIEI